MADSRQTAIPSSEMTEAALNGEKPGFPLNAHMNDQQTQTDQPVGPEPESLSDSLRPFKGAPGGRA